MEENLTLEKRQLLRNNEYYAIQNTFDEIYLKAREKTITKIKNQIKVIQKHRNNKEALKLNSIILGSHNYYRYATHVSKDFAEIDFLVRKTFRTRLKRVINNKPKLSSTYKRLYGRYNGKLRTIGDITIFPIYGCKIKAPMCFSQDICNYTNEGRELIHKNLYGYGFIIEYLLKDLYNNQSVEFNDNRISLMVGQKGKCYITGDYLQIEDMICHHKIPKELGGSDEYKNLVWLTKESKEMIESTNLGAIAKYLNKVHLDETGLKRFNSLRKLVGNSVI